MTITVELDPSAKLAVRVYEPGPGKVAVAEAAPLVPLGLKVTPLGTLVQVTTPPDPSARADNAIVAPTSGAVAQAAARSLVQPTYIGMA